MIHPLDEAIIAYTRKRKRTVFIAMYKAFVESELCVPISGNIVEFQPGHHDVPVIYVKTETRPK